MKINSICFVLYIMMMEFPFGLQFSAEGQDQCSGACSIENYWCGISPENYAMVNVTQDRPGRIACTIPSTTGQEILVVNHLGEEVRTMADLSNYVQQLPVNSDSQQTDNKSYELDILWVQDREIQERLKLLQCIAIFHGTSHLCKTSTVNLQFISNQESTAATATTIAGGESSNSDTSTTRATGSDMPSTTSGCTNVVYVTLPSAGQTQAHNSCTVSSTLNSLAFLLVLLIGISVA